MLSYGRFSYVPFLYSIFKDLHPKIDVNAISILVLLTENQALASPSKRESVTGGDFDSL